MQANPLPCSPELPAAGERRRLLRIQLVNGRAALRAVLSWGVIAIATLGAIGYVLPAHRVDEAASFHSNFADGGEMPLFVLAAVATAAYALRRRGLGAGIATGVIATGGAILAVMPVFLVHFLAHVEHAAGDDLFAVGVLGLFFGGIVTAIADPILYISQRRALERQDPQFPRARVVAG